MIKKPKKRQAVPVTKAQVKRTKKFKKVIENTYGGSSDPSKVFGKIINSIETKHKIKNFLFGMVEDNGDFSIMVNLPPIYVGKLGFDLTNSYRESFFKQYIEETKPRKKR